MSVVNTLMRLDPTLAPWVRVQTLGASCGGWKKCPVCGLHSHELVKGTSCQREDHTSYGDAHRGASRCKQHPAIPVASLRPPPGSAKAPSPLQTPANLSYYRDCGGAQLSAVTPFPVSVVTSPVESFSLKKLFNHQEEIGEFKQIQVMLLLQPCMRLSSLPSPVSWYLVGNTP